MIVGMLRAISAALWALQVLHLSHFKRGGGRWQQKHTSRTKPKKQDWL